MTIVLVVADGRTEAPATLERAARLRAATGRDVVVFAVSDHHDERPAPALIYDELGGVLESAATHIPKVLAVARVAEEALRPPSFPWWHLHDVPELLDPPAQVEVPRRAFRPVHQPGSSGKRTRQSQKLHNRRAA
jgi:hypothetical protein